MTQHPWFLVTGETWDWQTKCQNIVNHTINVSLELPFLHTREGFLQFSPVLTNLILYTLIRPVGQIIQFSIQWLYMRSRNSVVKKLRGDVLVGLGRSFFCLLLGPPGFNCWFSSAPVFQWCCSTPQGSPGVGRNTFLSSPHLCFIIVFICDLFVSRDDPLMS